MTKCHAPIDFGRRRVNTNRRDRFQRGITCALC